MKKMKLIGKTLMVALMVMSLAGMAWAGQPATPTDDGLMTAEIALSQEGNALIYPAFAAGIGLETKIKLINTSTQYCCRAKVVLRGQAYSQELLDFFVYLSPADEFTARIYTNNSGKVVIESTDGSVLNAANDFASNSDPMLVDIAVGNDCDVTEFGYITAFVDWYTKDSVISWLNNNTSFDTDLLQPPEVSKSDISDAIDLCSSPTAPSSLFGAEGFNDVTGNFEIGFPPPTGVGCMESAIAIENYDINTELTTARATALGTDSDTVLAEVEALLAKTDVALPYYNNTEGYSAHLFTFPTKLTSIDDSCDITGVTGPFFGQFADDYCVDVGLDYWDLEEEPNTGDPGSPYSGQEAPPATLEMCNELDIFLTAGGATTTTFGTFEPFQFDEGWANWDFMTTSTNLNACGPVASTKAPSTGQLCYTGAPVIPHVLHLGADGLRLMTGSYTDGVYEYDSN